MLGVEIKTGNEETSRPVSSLVSGELTIVVFYTRLLDSSVLDAV